MSKQADILQLLKDYRAFHSAFGGARSIDETHLAQAAYGPAGIILKGAEFARGDVKRLEASYEALEVALHFLCKEKMQLWGALIEPYLGDPADPGVVDSWREKIAELDKENALRRKNKKPEKVRLVWTRSLLTRHDEAIKELAIYLRDVDLYAVYPKLMSEKEKAAGEAANAQVYAYYQKVRVAGRGHETAVRETAREFGRPDDVVERIIEFRSDIKLASCAEPDCGRSVWRQNLCSAHYQRHRRVERKAG